MTGNHWLRRAASLLLSACVGVSMLGTAAVAETSSGKYYTAFATYQDEQDAAYMLNEELAGESFVLMKNRNNALPLSSDENMVTAFGIGSVYSSYGAQGSGTQSVSDFQTLATLKSGLQQAGISLNSAVYEAYAYAGSAVTTSRETSIGYAPYELTPEQLSVYETSFTLYNDAAILVITREGGEGEENEFSRTEYYDGAQKEDGAAYAHALMLTPTERSVLEYVEGKFDKVIVLINSTNVMELGELEDDDGVDAVLWIGGTGVSGFNAVGDVLTGKVNPSGRTADMWPANLTQDPTWYNYADQSGVISTTGSDAVAGEASKAYDSEGNTITFGSTDIQTVSYLEGIYFGYRWYETQAELGNYYTTDAMPNNSSATYDTADAYYNRSNGVVYPFGYGLSYTTFDWTDFSAELNDAGDQITVRVTVTNIGNVAGKDVVQIYYKDPYIDGQIEKASANLVSFAKTAKLQPGESETVTITFDVKDMASFDYNDANANGFTGYELDAGDYVISARSDSHTVRGEAAIALDAIRYDGSDDAHNYNAGYGETATAIFSSDDPESEDWLYNTAGQADIQTYISRAGGTLSLPTAVLYAQYDENWVTRLSVYRDYTAADAEEYHEKYNTTWVTNDGGIPETWTQAEEGVTEPVAITLNDMVGVDYPTYIYNSETNTVTEGDDEATAAWDAYLNQLTVPELLQIVSSGHGMTADPIERIGFDGIICNDGSSKIQGRSLNADLNGSYYDGTWWVSEVNIASTWNTELGYIQGLYIGNESLWEGVTGFNGFGLNTHSSAFGARTFEYYSEDGVLTGYINAAVTTGCSDMGVIVYNKHFALNDQDTYRNVADGVAVFVNEQALRQIYLRAYEVSIKNGNNNGMMMSFTRVGAISADNNYNLIDKFLRNELGLEGNICTDAGGGYCGDACILAGNDYPLISYTNNVSGEWNSELNTVTVNGEANATQYYAIRRSAMHFLYGIANSNATKNQVNTDAFDAKALQATNGRPASVSVAADPAELNATTASYTLIGGSLPEGLTLAQDGSVSGTASDVGTWSFTVRMNADTYLQKDADFTLIVNRVFAESCTEGKVGDEDFECVVSSDFVVVGDEYESVTYSAEGLPEGLTMAEDGTIYGTPAAAGTYEVTVKAVAAEPSTMDAGMMMDLGGADMAMMAMFGSSSTTYTETFTLTIIE